MAATSMEEYGIWEIEGYSCRVQYARAVIEEIRRGVVEGYLALPRGGVEVGGVLFGTREGDVVWVTSFRPLRCEHASGPAFVLSENDEATLRDLIAAPDKDPMLAGLRPVGWYHSHTRSGLVLSDRDLEIHKRFFPELWQVALLMQPEKGQPTRAAFFVRDADGSVAAEPGREELLLIAQPAGAPSRPAPRPPMQPRAERPKPAAVRLMQPEPVGKVPDLPAAKVANLPGRRSVRIDEGEPRGSIWRWAALALVFVLVAVGVFWALDRRESAETPELLLRAYDAGGQLLVSWDKRSPEVLRAESGTLNVLDGQRKVDLNLDGEQVRKGSVTYARETDRVDMKLTLFRAGSEPVEETVSFIGQPGPVKARAGASETARLSSEVVQVTRQRDQAMRERDEFRSEADKLRAEAGKLTARNRELEQGMRVLRQRLFVAESSRRR